MINVFDFAYENALFRQFKVNDLLFVEYKCLEDRSVFPIWSHCNYFVYVMKGKKKWQTLNEEFMVYEGEAILVKKGANLIHKFFEVDFCALFLFVPDDFIRNVYQASQINVQSNTGSSLSQVFPIYLDETLSTYFQSVFSYFLKNESPPISLLEIKFKELILNLICSSQNQHICNYFKSLGNNCKISIQEVMEANFSFNLKMEEFARLSNRSLTSFKRDFIEVYKTPPGRWLLKKRLEYGKRLLEISDKSINQIAFESGFENTSHFITVFKRAYNCTPLKLKKNGSTKLSIR